MLREPPAPNKDAEMGCVHPPPPARHPGAFPKSQPALLLPQSLQGPSDTGGTHARSSTGQWALFHPLTYTTTNFLLCGSILYETPVNPQLAGWCKWLYTWGVFHAAHPLLATTNWPLRSTPLCLLSPEHSGLFLGTRCWVRSELKTG